MVASGIRREAVAALLDAVRALYAARGRHAGPDAAMAARLAERFERLSPRPLPHRESRLPVCTWLDEALLAGETGPDAAVVRALRAVLGAVEWRQTYDEAAVGALFLARYGWFDVASPRGLVVTDACAVGVLLLGPETLYPPHVHPAVELYHVLAGSAEWWLEGGDWQARPTGSAVHLPSGTAHAMRTEAGPLLALYAWLGDLDTPARLVSRRDLPEGL